MRDQDGWDIVRGGIPRRVGIRGEHVQQPEEELGHLHAMAHGVRRHTTHSFVAAERSGTHVRASTFRRVRVYVCACAAM